MGLLRATAPSGLLASIGGRQGLIALVRYWADANGLFTPTEAAAVAAFYGLFVGMVIHRGIARATFPDCEAAELAVIMIVITGIFAWALSTLM